MKRILLPAIILAIICCLNSCSLISNISTYKKNTETFANSLINRDFDKCISLMAMDKNVNVNLAQFKVGLDTFRSVIVRNFGTKLEYNFMRSEKKFSSDKEDQLPPNTTLVFIEFHNTKEIGVFQVLFDDKNNKIYNIKTLDVKQVSLDNTKPIY